MPSPIEQVTEALKQTRAEATDLLADQQSISIIVESSLTRLINQLSRLSGSNQVESRKTAFAPVTDFLGTPIKRPEPIRPEDVEPEPDDREIFLSKVQALQSNIRERDPETLIRDFSSEPNVLRKVAKNAGLLDYRDGLINIDFIERIKQGLTSNETKVKELKKINKKLNEGNS